MRTHPTSRADARRLARVVALLLGTVLTSGVAAVMQAGPATGAAGSTAPHRASFSPTLVAAVDAPPVPVDVVFAKPQSPGTAIPRVAPPARPVAHRTATAPAALPSATCAGPGWQQRRGEAALGSLLHPVPQGVSVAFLPGRGGLKGMTYYDRHAVEVYVGSCAGESDALLRHVVAHEMGHAWDSLHMTASLRTRYLAARGIPTSTPWFGCNTCQDFATPAGDFAETYAQWQRGAADSRSRLAPPASASELAALGAEFFG